MHEKIIILDFGGQYAHLIANRIRRQNVLAEIWDVDTPIEKFQHKNVKGIILSGGPQSVFEKNSPKCDPAIFDLGKPILGICYGHQFITHALGGTVSPGKRGEFGQAGFTHDERCPIFSDLPSNFTVWMNHVDEVTELPAGFDVCGSTDQCHYAAMWNGAKEIFSTQFHLEVTHTQNGIKVFQNFLKICHVKKDWTMEKFLEEEKKRILKQVGKKKVFLFVSGGVDSTVAFAFLVKILGPKRVKGLFVDTGMLRAGEVEFVESALRGIGADLTVLFESDRFLKNLENIFDPEEKRQIIGRTFLDVQRDFFTKHGLHGDWLLGQGTIYPDTIETGGTKHADKIKTHHNRAPEVQELIQKGKIVEPLKELYKDEVRALGELLGLPADMVFRHPFPGPGLGVRILCSDQSLVVDATAPSRLQVGTCHGMSLLQKDKRPFITLPIRSVGVQGDFRTYRHPAILSVNATAPSRLQVGTRHAWSLQELEKLSTNLINHYSDINRCLFLLDQNFEGKIREILLNKKCIQKERVEMLQRADDIVTRTLQEMNLYQKVWQFPTVLLPVAFNSVGEESIVLRPIDSVDAMSASVGKLPWDFFAKVAAGILQDERISAVFLDTTSKPPGTIEWE